MSEVMKKSDIAVVDVPSSAVTPMEMIDRALSSGAPVETLERLMGLHERWEANKARREFDEAVACAKSEIGPVMKNKTGHNSKRYADFSAYAKEIDPIISKFGLSYRFRTQQDDRIHVTCVLSHRSGHSEENTLVGPPDNTGNKNAIQSIGSTLTYLQRYSLIQALGLSASDDDDGASAEYDISPWLDRIRAADKDTIGVIASDLKAMKDIPEPAMKLIRNAWAGRKNELEKQNGAA